MKLYELGTIMLIITSITIVIGIGSRYFFGDDNQVEELCETIVEETTDIDVDFSPESKETKES